MKSLLHSAFFLSGFYLVISVVAFMSIGYTLIGEHEHTKYSQFSLEMLADQATQAFDANMAHYSHILYGTRGLLYSSQNVTRQEFNVFTQSLDLPRTAPGVSGIFYFKLISNADKAAFITQQQRSNDLEQVDLSRFQIWPATTKEQYLVNTYGEPSNLSNIRDTLGFDFTSDPVRQAAFEQATQDNQATMTKPVMAAVNKAQIFVLILPVFDQSLSIVTPSERLQAVVGSVALGFRSEQLFNRAFEVFYKQHPDLQIKVYDGETTAEDHLVYDSNLSKEVLGADTFSKTQTKTRVIEAGNRTWTLSFTEPSVRITSWVTSLIMIVTNAAIGTVSFLLFWCQCDRIRFKKI